MAASCLPFEEDLRRADTNMKHSVDRILTTHVGSLPRPPELIALLKDADRGLPVDRQALDRRVAEAVDATVRRQREIGLDIVNDGEQGKADYSTYIKHRLSGFDGEIEIHPKPRDVRDFPEFFAAESISTSAVSRPSCTGPVAWKDFDAVRKEIALLAATAKRVGVPADEIFMTAVSPGQAARFLGNRYYRSHEEYVFALAGVLKREYDAIAGAGFGLQVDCPDLASGWNNQFADATVAEFRSVVSMHVAALNEATRDVPRTQLRLHLCWGNYSGPHNHDIPLGDILDLVFTSRATAISLEGANPRHEHEWRTFEENKLPEGTIVIPGVIDSVSNFVEHPRVVADRIMRFAKVVGRENVVAGTDCGFATFAERPAVHPTIAWAKLQSLVEGARIASRDLWR